MCGHQVLSVILRVTFWICIFMFPIPLCHHPPQASASYLNEFSLCSCHWVCIVAVPLLKVWTVWVTWGFVSNVQLWVLYLLNQELLRAGPKIAVIWWCAPPVHGCAPPVHGCAPRPLVMWKAARESASCLCLPLTSWNVDCWLGGVVLAWDWST